MKVRCVVQQTVTYDVEVEVDNPDDAFDRVSKDYKDGFLDLYNGNIIETQVGTPVDIYDENTDYVFAEVY